MILAKLPGEVQLLRKNDTYDGLLHGKQGCLKDGGFLKYGVLYIHVIKKSIYIYLYLVIFSLYMYDFMCKYI